MGQQHQSMMEPDVRRCILVIAAISIVFFIVEGGASLAFGWFSAFFDALDFFERAVVLSILYATPLWSLGARYAITAIIVLPCLILLTTGAYYFWPGSSQQAPLATLIWLTVAVGSIALNVGSFIALRRFRQGRSVLGRVGYLAARADVWSSVAVLLAAIGSYVVHSRWPDIAAAAVVLALHLAALWQQQATSIESADGK